MEEKKLLQDDFAEQLGLSPEDFELLIQGNKNISADIAKALSESIGASEDYWLNLKQAFDTVIEKF